MYSLKSLNITATKVPSSDKLKAEFDEAMGEKTCLKGQLHQAIKDMEGCKAKRNLSRARRLSLRRELLSCCQGLPS